MTCPNCTTPNPPDATRCRKCGAPLRRPSSNANHGRSPSGANYDKSASRDDHARPSSGDGRDRPREQYDRRPVGAQPRPRDLERRPPAGARQSHPSQPDPNERKYVIVGAITVAVFLVVIIMLIWSLACTCAGKKAPAEEDYAGDTIVSDSYAGFVSDDDVSGADIGFDYGEE